MPQLILNSNDKDLMPTFIINFVNNTFSEVIGKKNLIIPKGINKHDKITVFNTKMVIDVIPIRFSNKNFTCSSQTL